ncbi:MAG: LURP-one-related family protein [Clostridia bacterium]|nr:LURP-one-related family protein [Clostridia bacterium]
MEFYIRQKIFSFCDKFSVYDADGNTQYTAVGEVFTFGKKLHLYDSADREAAFISQELFVFRPRYTVYRSDKQIAQVVKEFTFFHPEYTVEGLGWTVHGDFFDHDYEITDAEGHTIASVSKEWFTLGDAYRIWIDEGADSVIALAVVLVIDACIAAERD